MAKITVTCGNCEIKFEKNPSEINKSGFNYCSRKCSAVQNNKRHPKRRPEGTCMDCSAQIPKVRLRCKPCGMIAIQTRSEKCICGMDKELRSVRCLNCYTNNLLSKTKEDFQYINKNNKASKHTRIREQARKIAKENGLYEKGCNSCGYTKHVEICHIKPVSSFEDGTLITEINNVSNLVQLCPNCHWEFDHKK